MTLLGCSACLYLQQIVVLCRGKKSTTFTLVDLLILQPLLCKYSCISLSSSKLNIFLLANAHLSTVLCLIGEFSPTCVQRPGIKATLTFRNSHNPPFDRKFLISWDFEQSSFGIVTMSPYRLKRQLVLLCTFIWIDYLYQNIFFSVISFLYCGKLY